MDKILADQMPTTSCSSSSQLFNCPECPKKDKKNAELQEELTKLKKDKEKSDKNYEDATATQTALQIELEKEKKLRETAEARYKEATTLSSNSSGFRVPLVSSAEYPVHGNCLSPSQSTTSLESELFSLRQLVALKEGEIARLCAMVTSREQAVSEAIELVAEHKQRASLAEQRFSRLQASVRATGQGSPILAPAVPNRRLNEDRPSSAPNGRRQRVTLNPGSPRASSASPSRPTKSTGE